MTRLDQAFIKVYTQQDEAPPATPDSAEPAPGKDAPADRLPEQTDEIPVGVSANEVLEMLQQTTARIGDLLPAKSAEDQALQGSHDAESVSGIEDGLPSAAREELGLSGAIRRVDPGGPFGSGTGQIDGGPIQPPHVPLPKAEDLKGTAGLPWAGDPQNDATVEVLSSGTFRPMLQVDHFTWPVVCCRLGRAAADQMDRLADRLAEAIARGKKVVAVGGCRRGEGATTLLLCAGRRLAERGVKVIMVDANLADPQVACRLGLLPQSGWEDVLAGRLSLQEVVIESAADRLAVLPVRKTSAGSGEGSDDGTRLAESLETLAAHYDLVLLDSGPLEELGVAGASLARGIGSRLDAIALVHNAHLTPPEDLAEISRGLADSDVAPVGVIENFVGD